MTICSVYEQFMHEKEEHFMIFKGDYLRTININRTSYTLIMSLFQCDKCGCMENTALTYCSHDFLKNMIRDSIKISKYKKEIGLSESDPLGNYCSVCCPAGKKEWHGKFDRIYLPKGEFETAPNGNLRNKKTLDEDVRKYALKIESR